VCVLLYISCTVILLILNINNTPTPLLFYFTPCPLQHLSFHIHGKRPAILSDTTIHSYDPNRPIPHTVTDQESFNPDGTESILRNATVKLQGGRTGEIESSCTSLRVDGYYRLPLGPYPYHSFFALSLSLCFSPSLSLCFYLSHSHTHALSFPLSPSHFASSSGVCSCG
jgi:hypothetical protein